MKTPSIAPFLFAAAVVLSSTGAVGAAAAPALPLPPSSVTATGRATIYDQDLAGARDRAVEAALLRAVEQYAGLRIESSTLIKKGELIDREVRSHARGFVKSYDVTEAKQDGTEMVVQLRAEISPTPVEQAFRRLVSSTTTLLLVRETNLGKPLAGQVLPAFMADPFFTSKVVVPPVSTLETAGKRLPASFLSGPDPATAKELGLRHLAGLIVVASAATKKLDSSAGSVGYDVGTSVLRPVVAAEGNVWILSGQDGRLIASRRFDDIRGSDASDPARAGIKALTDLAGRMRAFLVEKLSEHVQSLGQGFRVTVTGPAAAEGAARVRQILQNTRWVKRVDVASEEPGRTVLQVTAVEIPFYVVEELRHSSGLKVTRFDAERAEVAVQ